ncbi:Radical SAM domain protein [Ammonifex degensii KC4]|uniref:Radical SAM domain protein n=1 Tax=Ammonifex degensii (strain DSM 10501 / KC4) TaxID=429009 RepID=C9RB59_AMMDK|nr:radical SAM protein [Ammonifex degensii]ACX51486.1 Radical SAM domain protein [Ammonifex degensii KC4]
MRLLLVSPLSGPPEERRRGKGLLPPLSLLTVAGLTPPEVEIKLVDEAVEELEISAEWDLVGITATTAQAPRAYEIAQAFRALGVPVVLGGIHPTALPEEAAQYADAVVIGEAEGLWPQVIADAKAGRLKRFYRHPEGKFPELKDVRPRRDLLKKDAYVLTSTVQVTRGCPYGCAFCSVTRFFGRTYRTRPIQEVLEEVASLKEKVIIFVDDNIMGLPSYARRLFEALKGLGKHWLSQASLPQLQDETLIKLAAESGCKGLFVGFESLSPEELKRVRKFHNDTRRYVETIKRLHKYGIGVIGSFIVGLDSDDKSVFERIKEFAFRAKLDLLQASILTPLPGTLLYEEMEREGRIVDRDWSKYNGNHVVFRPRLLTVEELQRGFRQLLKETYSWGGILRRLLGIHWRWPIFGTLNLIFRQGVKSYLRRVSQLAAG